VRPRITVACIALLVAFIPAARAAAGAPTNQTAPTISGTPAEGSTLTASPGTWTGSPTSYAYTWRRCKNGSCVNVTGGTASTYVVAHADVGFSLRVIVKASNASGTGTARSVRTAVVTAATTDTTPPTQPGSFAVVGTTQTSVSTSWSASNDNTGVAGYNGYRNGAKVWAGASTSYAFGGLACGTSYALAVAAYDAAGNVSAQATLNATTAACTTATAPSSTSAPTVSGTAQVGSTLTTTNGAWSGTTPMTYAYQWQDCDSAGSSCTAIAGATGSSYTLASGDQGHTVRSRVTASNGAGSSSASSGQTAVVQAASGGNTALSGVHVSGNQLVNGSGAAVRLHGVNYSGTEYACIQGWGIFDGPSDSASVKAIAAWHANIVHLGLNEDCILGINGVSAQYSGSNYLNAITAYVNLLHANGLYAEVSLMWAAPGSQQALDHPQILDADHAGAALQAIGNAFKNDPNTIIGLQSEPHDIGWACWKNGGSSCSVGYTALGMQGALNAVRSSGSTNVVTASGISYAITWLCGSLGLLASHCDRSFA